MFPVFLPTKILSVGVLGRTEELLAAGLLNDLDQTGLELLNRGNVVGEDTHLTRLGGDVDLDDILGLVDGLQSACAAISFGSINWPSTAFRDHPLPLSSSSYLVREGQAQLDLL
jgi:hypothetical protein